ncbi:hypothetical protein PVNG_05961 [Plasmodium vivax North Korean]|uniref:VIR protein n=1 Tax=Plasmodium vivax North Korean TaxID=1035514 RepID=A0A0J9TMR5_PLAVI|nr:hypothetical protein PVNG_05961 [Plasmodium vivax North Korean]
MECHNQTKEVIFLLYIVIIYNNYIFKRITHSKLHYNCYDKLKYYFERSELTENGKKILNGTINKLEEKWPNIDKTHKIFSELTRFLIKHHNFVMYGYPVSCKYINFWLNDQVINNYSNEFQSKFHIFRDFAKEFVTESKKHDFSRDSCESYIEELVDEKYHKKQMLYNLYDLYTQHKSYLDDLNREQLCNNIYIIVKASHDAEKYIEKDTNFAKVLKDLKDLIQKEKYQKEKCDYSSLINMLPKEVPEPKIETTHFPVVKPTLQGPLPIAQHKDLKHETGDINRKVETVLLETEGLPQGSKLEEMVAVTAMAPLQNLQEELSFRVSQEGDPLDRTMSQANPLFRTWHQESRPLKQKKELTQADYHLYGDTQRARSDERGVLGSIQNTLSEVLGSVEPAPILGVSGGMGALFLLFKVLKTKF